MAASMIVTYYIELVLVFALFEQRQTAKQVDWRIIWPLGYVGTSVTVTIASGTTNEWCFVVVDFQKDLATQRRHKNKIDDLRWASSTFEEMLLVCVTTCKQRNGERNRQFHQLLSWVDEEERNRPSGYLGITGNHYFAETFGRCHCESTHCLVTLCTRL